MLSLRESTTVAGIGQADADAEDRANSELGDVRESLFAARLVRRLSEGLDELPQGVMEHLKAARIGAVRKRRAD